MFVQEEVKLELNQENFNLLQALNEKLNSEIDSYMDMFLAQKQKADDYAKILVHYANDKFEDDSDVEASLVRFSVGGAVGANFYPGGGNFAIAPSLGLRFNFYNGEWEDTSIGFTGDLNGHSTTIFLNCAFLFGR